MHERVEWRVLKHGELRIETSYDVATLFIYLFFFYLNLNSIFSFNSPVFVKLRNGELLLSVTRPFSSLLRYGELFFFKQLWRVYVK